MPFLLSLRELHPESLKKRLTDGLAVAEICQEIIDLIKAVTVDEVFYKE